MKKLIPSVLPALALLTLGGCAGTSVLSTTESDGIYYSSKDRVSAPAQAVASTIPATEDAGVSSDDVANPDYAGPGSTNANGNTEYYDEDYYYASRLRRFHQTPYRGMGLGYYDFAYTDPFWYGGPMYSAWGPGAFYDPWYGGSFVNINIGFGRPWYRPFGYGYGYSAYDYYGGYGRPWGGYGFGNGYGYGNGYYNGGGAWGGYYDRPGRRATTYGARRGRESEVTGVAAPNGGISTTGRSRVQEGGFNSPTSTPTSSGIVSQPGSTGRRVQEVPVTGLPEGTAGGRTRVRAEQPTETTQSGSTAAEQPAGGRRWRVLETTTGNTTTPAGQPSGTVSEPTPRRRFDYGNGTSGNNGGRQAPQSAPTEQPRRQSRFSESSSQPTRTYSEPSRSYSEPSRSYSEPSRSSSSGSNGGGGGGNSGGGRRGRVQ